MIDRSLLPQAPAEPTKLGNYRILRKIGEGGMGSVYEAEQDNPRRTVALKVIRSGVSSDKVLKRFEFEAQVLGRLQHPGIAQIFEAGSAESGGGAQPFFAMELVHGLPVTEYVEEKGLGTRQKLALMAKICDAVHHAHQKGVIHRDLKPANILVEAEGQPKILDFGVARATDTDTSVTLQTDVGQLLGTLPYMSPEQVSGDSLDVDTRSDVYALGVILYEMLAGRPPYDLRHQLVHDAVRIIREVDPTPLSSVNRIFRGDLETIVAKALEKDKGRRYSSTLELAADIDHYLRDEPIVARRPSALYQLRKFTRRHKAVVAGVCAVFVVLLAGSIVSTWQAVRAVRAEKQARAESVRAQKNLEASLAAQQLALDREARALREESKATAVRDFLLNMLASADPYRVRSIDVTVREVLDESEAALASGYLREQPEVAAAVLRTLGGTYASLHEFARAERLLRRSLELRRGFGVEHELEVAESSRDLAALCNDIGKHDEAVQLLDTAQAIHRRRFGNDSLDLASDLEHLAQARYNQDCRDEAIAIYREVLAMRRRALDGSNADIAVALHNLAFQLQEQRRLDEAEPLMREALDIHRIIRGPAHALVARELTQLGRLLEAQSHHREAEDTLLEAVAIWRLSQGNESAEAADALTTLGEICIGEFRTAEADAYTREALSIRRKMFGDHRDVATELHQLASVRQQAGDYEEAVSLAREGLEMRRRLYTETSSPVGDSLRRLGLLLYHHGKFSEAEEVLRQAIAIWTVTLGEDHPDLAYPMLTLGCLRRDRGDLEESESLLLRALSVRQARQDPFTPDLIECRDELVQTMLFREEWREVEELLIEALRAYGKHYRPDHPLLSHTRIQLGSALAGLGRFEEAESLMLPAWIQIKGNPKLWKETRVQAVRQIVELYGKWNRDDKVAEWSETLEELVGPAGVQ